MCWNEVIVLEWPNYEENLIGNANEFTDPLINKAIPCSLWVNKTLPLSINQLPNANI